MVSAKQVGGKRLHELARQGVEIERAPVEVHVARFDENLPVHEWPAKPRLIITAIDTGTGDLAAWDADAQVPLAAAVAASCALPGVFPPVRIGDGHYMDGGLRSNTNADLATGADSVIVLAPSGSMFRTSPEEELEMLGVSRGLVLMPDAAARAAIGRNILDPGRRGPALAAGIAQASAVAAAVAENWG